MTSSGLCDKAPPERPLYICFHKLSGGVAFELSCKDYTVIQHYHVAVEVKMLMRFVIIYCVKTASPSIFILFTLTHICTRTQTSLLRFLSDCLYQNQQESIFHNSLPKIRLQGVSIPAFDDQDTMKTWKCKWKHLFLRTSWKQKIYLTW